MRALMMTMALLSAAPAMAGNRADDGGGYGTGGQSEGKEADTAGKLMNDINDQRQRDFWNGVVRSWFGGPRNEGGSSSNGGSASYGGNQAERAGF